MIESTFDSCLLYIKNSENSEKINEILENHDILSESFEIVELQINDSLMLENKVFADIEEKELKKAKLILKLEKS
jgi:hypothetical protein